MKKILNIILLFLIIGCSKKIETLNSDVEKIEIDISKAKAVDIANDFEVVDYIPLESTKESMMGRPSNMHLSKAGYFFVYKNKVCAFDAKGKFKFIINKVGRGPGEYLTIANINVSKDTDTITVYDRIGRKIINYDGVGNLINEQFINLFAIDCMKISDDLICAYVGALSQKLTDKRVNFYSKSLKKITNSFIPITKYERKSDHFLQNQNFVRGDSCCYLSYIYHNIVYKITSNDVKQAFLLDFGKYTMPSDFKQRNFKEVSMLAEEIEKNRYISNRTPDISKDYLHMGFNQDGILFYMIYNRKTKTTTVINKFVLSPFEEIEIDLKGLCPYIADSEYFYYLIEPNLIIEKIDEIKKILSKERWVVFCSMYPKLIKLYNKIDIFDNSIIVKVKIKNL